MFVRWFMDIVQIWPVLTRICYIFCVQRQDAKKSKNECVANKISEILKFSNLKNLDFFGKYIVGEHWNLPLCSEDNNRVPVHVVHYRDANFTVHPLYIFRKNHDFWDFWSTFWRAKKNKKSEISWKFAYWTRILPNPWIYWEIIDSNCYEWDKNILPSHRKSTSEFDISDTVCLVC